MLYAILYLLLYALLMVLVLELIFWIIGMFIPIPPKVRQILYAIAGVILLIYLLQIVLGSGSILPPLHR